MKGKTQTYLDKHPEARKVKAATDKKINARPEQIKKRVELNTANRKSQAAGKTKIGDGLDKAHTKRGLVNQPQSKNRGSKSAQPGDKRARG